MSLETNKSQANPNLNKRIIIALVLFIAFVFGSFVFYQISKRDEKVLSSLSSLRTQYIEFELDFSRKTLAISNFASTLHGFKTSHPCGFDFDSLSQKYLRNELENFDFAKGMGFMFEPYEFDHSQKLYKKYVYKNENKEIISFDSLANNSDYLKDDYYTNCLPADWDRLVPRDEATYWSSPYYDSTTTNSMLLTVSSPIYDNENRIIGISAVNLNLKGLMMFTKASLPTSRSESFILQLSSNTILSNTLDTNSSLKPISSLDWLNKDLLAIDSSSIKYEKVTIYGNRYKMYLISIADNYVFGFLIPYEDYYSPLIVPFIITLLSGFLIIYIVLYLVKKSFKTITDLNTKTTELNLYLRTIMNATPDIIIIQDLDLKLLDSNSKFMETFGYSLEGTKSYDLESISVMANMVERAKLHTKNAIENGSERFDWVFRKSNEETFPAMVRLQKIRIDNQDYISTVITDITQIKQREQEIEELNANLESKVIERTTQYEDTMIELREEIESHKQTELELKQTNEELSLLNETIADDSKRLLFLNEEIAVSEQKLREANIAKDKFISILAHDIKNPIHSIMISSEFFVSEAANLDFEQTLNVANTIHKSVSHISTLLDDLLLWSRSQSGTMQFTPSSIIIKDLVLETANVFKQAFERKEIAFSVNIPPDLVFNADKNMLSTILRNLISNAIKFSHIGSLVSIDAEDSKYRDYIEITVSDQGVGISKENIAKLFRKDISVSSKGTLSETGTGLGLLLCKEFMDRHQGTITVDSKISSGTVFTIRFPKID